MTTFLFLRSLWLRGIIRLILNNNLFIGGKKRNKELEIEALKELDKNESEKPGQPTLDKK